MSAADHAISGDDSAPAPRRFPSPRAYLRVTGFMLAGLCVLNVLLFQLDGLDFLLYMGAGLGAFCLLYPRFEKHLPALGWVGAVLTLPFWPLALFLAYHLAAGGLAHLAARPIPPELARKTPPASEIALHREIVATFPAEEWRPNVDAPVAQAINTLATGLGEIVRPKDPVPPETVLARPETLKALETADLPLEEYLNLLAQGPAAPSSFQKDSYSDTVIHLRRWMFQAEKMQILHRWRLGNADRGAGEAQTRFLRLLKISEHGLNPHQNMVALSNEITLLTWLLEQQNDFAPGLLAGIEEPVLESVRACRERLAAAERGMWTVELENYREGGVKSRMEDRKYRFANQLTREWDPLWYLEKRSSYFPFVVEADCVDQYARWIERRLTAPRLPVDAERKAVDRDVMRVTGGTHPLRKAFTPNAVGRAWIPGFGRSHIGIRFRQLESMLVAYESALEWSLAQPDTVAELPPDPMTLKPYYTRMEPAGNRQDLYVAGGKNELMGRKFRRRDQPMAAAHIHGDYLFWFRISRPSEKPL